MGFCVLKPILSRREGAFENTIFDLDLRDFVVITP